jgi:hypothetical protein
MRGRGCRLHHPWHLPLPKVTLMLLILILAAAGTLIPVVYLAVADRTPRPAG